MTESTKTCLECGHAIHMKFCAHCGQKTATARLTLEALFHQVVEVLTHITNRAFFTFYESVLRPGETIQAYLDGKRKSYQSPASIFALGYALLFGASWLLRIHDLSGHPLKSFGTLTALDKPVLFLGMILIAVVTHALVVHPRFYAAETIAAFMYVYGSAFVIAIPVMVGAEAYQTQISDKLGEMSFLAVDAPVIIYIVVQPVRMALHFELPLRRVSLVILFGVSFFLLVRFVFGVK